MKQTLTGKRSVDDVIQEYGDSARNRLIPHFEKGKIPYPPKRISLLAVKDQATLEVWASLDTTGDAFTFIHTYDIQKLSGKAEPKLREGDKQVPEGIYKIIGLNPNSAYHLSLKLNYPNEFDLIHAKAEGRD